MRRRGIYHTLAYGHLLGTETGSYEDVEYEGPGLETTLYRWEAIGDITRLLSARLIEEERTYFKLALDVAKIYMPKEHVLYELAPLALILAERIQKHGGDVRRLRRDLEETKRTVAQMTKRICKGKNTADWYWTWVSVTVPKKILSMNAVQKALSVAVNRFVRIISNEEARALRRDKLRRAFDEEYLARVLAIGKPNNELWF